ncbi:MAG TPA: LytTR family DNA-binding domain-containing protein [Saprospiraceae bacterium]|nr:LytTR family DNA-binding domain-containing protein [Saprospiraceae bacterium]HNM24264.1 LytTR family DNA-binding domain-containing protein [Saprospiraceae bacterium]
MKILIIEDEYRTALDLQATLFELEPDAMFLPVIDTVAAAVRFFQTQAPPDLAFFDVQLADGVSFDVFEEAEVKCPVVFCTAFDEYALQAFQTNGIDYVLKPFDRTAIARALDKVRRLENYFQHRVSGERLPAGIRPATRKSTFLVSQRDRLLPIAAEDVAYFHIEHEVTFLHTFDGRRFIVSFTLEELEQSLDPDQFYRANRQFLVNFRAVQEVQQYFARKLLLKLNVSTRDALVVSKAKAGDFLRWMERI